MTKLHAAFLALLLCVAACAEKNPFLIERTRVDNITIGMPRSALASTRSDITFGKSDSETCTEASVPSKGLTLLIEQGAVTRIYITNPAYVTAKDIHVGSTEKEAIAAYGKPLQIEPHKYVANAHYLSLIGDDAKGFNFETDGTTITHISIGQLPALKYVERCL